MRLETGDLLAGVVVVDAELEVIAATHDPILAGDEAAGADGDVGELEGLDDALRLVGPDVDVAAVEGGEDPGLGGVEVDAFDSFAAGEELALQVESDLRAHDESKKGCWGRTLTSSLILTAGPHSFNMACKGAELSSVRLMRCGVTR